MLSSASALNGAYGPADRLLHRLALSWRPVIETSFDLECAIFGKVVDRAALDRPIFVCGLARAGTSLVTRLIAAAPGMGFPSYRDMPFPLAANLWARLSGKHRRLPASQRGHGDGMTHDLDTPEAVEEVFWRCFEGHRYRRRDGLAPTPADAETVAKFRRYVALVVLRAGASRYLSKNNNNILRVRLLAETFPDALFVHPFRDPASQAESLRRQHERAQHLQQMDRFRLHYADWLGHHEFGTAQLPFLLPGSPAAGGNRQSLDYWLDSWNGVYGYLLEQPDALRERQFFLDYDALCRSPDIVLAALSAFLGTGDLCGRDVRSPAIHEENPPTAASPGVEETYRSLLARSSGQDQLSAAVVRQVQIA